MKPYDTYYRVIKTGAYTGGQNPAPPPNLIPQYALVYYFLFYYLQRDNRIRPKIEIKTLLQCVPRKGFRSAVSVQRD